MSPGQVSKDGRLEETLYMENALMQQPSHMSWEHFIKLFHFLIIYIEIIQFRLGIVFVSFMVIGNAGDILNHFLWSEVRIIICKMKAFSS